MVPTNSTLAIATTTMTVAAIIAVSAFGFVSPLIFLQPAYALSPIPAPSSCTYRGHPVSPISQTLVALPSSAGSLLVKHAEKELYDCIISGTTAHYILDTTTFSTFRSFDGSFSNAFVECGKEPSTGTVYSCQTEVVGNKLATTSSCSQVPLAFPQQMNTVVVNGNAVTVESQKEIFKCSTINGPVIQEIIFWTFGVDDTSRPPGTSPTGYAVETCQKPYATPIITMTTTTNGFPTLNCQTTGNFAFLPDLVIPSFVAPSSANSGNVYTTTVVEKNQGLLTAGSHTVGVYLSNTPSVTAGSFLLNQVSVTSLAGGQLITLTIPITIPSAATLQASGFSIPGKAYIVVFADNQKNVAESNENNNQFSSATMIIS